MHAVFQYFFGDEGQDKVWSWEITHQAAQDLLKRDEICFVPKK
jgi:hypothetical protein